MTPDAPTRRARTLAGASPDVPGLQTAAALELTAVLTYEAVLAMPAVSGGDRSVAAALAAFRDHHADHAAAFQAATTAAGGAPQVLPEAGLLATVRRREPTALTLADALVLTADVEQVVVASAVRRVATAGTAALRTLYAGTAAVTAQHVAYLALARPLVTRPGAADTDLGDRLRLDGAASPAALPPVSAGVPTAFATTSAAVDAGAGTVR